MEALTVLEHDPAEYQVLYDPLLYNSAAFLSANNSLPQLHFYLADQERKVLLAHMAFSREESEVVSPYRAPFGGVEFATDLDSAAMLFFVQEVNRRLSLQYVRFVRIKLPPAFYLPQVSLVPESLRALGFSDKGQQTYHGIPVDSRPLEEKIATMERRRLKKAYKEELSFRFAPRSEYSAVFDFIKTQRELRGQSLSLDWDELKGTIRQNTDRYMFATVSAQGTVLAASLLVKVSSRVIYSFYPAHDSRYNNLSPMVFLLAELYIWCQQESIRYIDLGTSYTGTEVNQSLVDFKEHMGAEAFISASFRKALSS